MLLKRVADFDILRIEKLQEHPKQTEARLFIEIYLGSDKYKTGIFSFEGKKEVDINKTINSDIFFGTRVEFWVRQANNKDILAHTSINFEEFFAGTSSQRYIKLNLGDMTFFGISFSLSFTTETIKEITAEDIEREIAEKEEAERLRREKEEEEARIKAELEEKERARIAAEEAAKKAKYHPITLTTRVKENDPYY